MKDTSKLVGYVQDRRGFHTLYASGFLFCAVGFVSMVVFGRWIVGIACIFSGFIIIRFIDICCKIPDNNPLAFIQSDRAQSEQGKDRKGPVLVCLGDSITQGKIGANWVDRIPAKYSSIQVVNAGQNSVPSYICAKERAQPVLDCLPDYISLLIGSNDVVANSSSLNIPYYLWTWNMTQDDISWEGYERNLTEVLLKLVTSTNIKLKPTKVAVCTLPPMSESLDPDTWGHLIVGRANDIIRRVVATVNVEQKRSGRPQVTILPVYESIMEGLAKRQSTGVCLWRHPPIRMFFLAGVIVSVPKVLFGSEWGSLARTLFGHYFLIDSLHLTEGGGEIVADLVSSWVAKEEVEKMQ